MSLSEMALDLRSIASLEPVEGATLQVMREYIRAASIAKMAKVRLWESENMALLQLAGGGGGGAELLAFRNLSQHVKVHRLVPEGGATPTPTTAAAPKSGGKGGGAAPAQTQAAGGAKGGATGGKEGSGAPVGAPGSEVKEGGITERRVSSLSAKAGMVSKAISSNLTTKGVFGKPRADKGAAAESAAAASGGISEAAWPVGARLPSNWHAAAQPGALVMTLRAHPEGVRQLCLSPDARLLYSRGRASAVQAWSPTSIIESNYPPAARHAPPAGSHAVAMAVSGDEHQLALGSSDGSVQLLVPERFGTPTAAAWSFNLKPEDGALLTLAPLAGDSAQASASATHGSATPGFSHLLMYTTEAGGAHAVDPRAGREAWKLTHETPLGLMQAHASDAGANWLVFGSSTGHCVLWDVRYAIRLHSWQCPTAPRIRSMLHVRAAGTQRPTVLIGADENLVSGWEISETPRCTLMLQPSDASDAAAAAAAAAPAAPLSLLPSQPTLATAASHGPHSVRALLAPLDGSCVLSCSSDTRLRCWRLLPSEAARSFCLGQLSGSPPSSFVERALPSGCRVIQERAEARALATGEQLSSSALSHRAATVGHIGMEDRGSAAAVTCAAYVAPPSGLLAAGSLDGTVRVWR